MCGRVLLSLALTLAAKQGILLPVEINILQQHLPEILEDAENRLSHVLRRLLSSLLENMHSLNEHITTLTQEIASLCQQQPRYKALHSLSRVWSHIIAAAFLSEVMLNP